MSGYFHFKYDSLNLLIEVDGLIPADGKDEMYNEVVSEIGGLDSEKSLEADLLKFEKKNPWVC